MKTVADLKRALVVGSKLKLLERSRDGVADQSVDPRQVKTVVRVQGNSFCTALRADARSNEWIWCDWPKASELSYPEPGKFCIQRGAVRLTFELVD